MILLACLMFGTFSVLVRVADMEAVGLWVLLNSLLNFSRAADFWSIGLVSFVGEARGKGEAVAAAGFVSTAVLSGVVGYAVLAGLGASTIWIFAEPLAGGSDAGLVRDIVPLMALTFWLLALAGTYGGAFLAFGRPIFKASQTVGGATLFLVLALLLAPRYGLWGILIAQALQGGVMFVCAAAVFHGYIATSSKVSWDVSQFRQLAAYGSKAIFVGIVQLAIEPVIRLLASHFGGLGFVAIVELASRLIAVVRNVIIAIGQLLVPEFARLGVAAKDQLATFYFDISRMFLLASISAFSLLASAAPFLEEAVLGQSGTGFVGFLLLLSIGWFANTVTAPAYYLLLSRRRLRPLLWSHLIMTPGAVAFGIVGGLFAGIDGAIAGAATALVLASLYLAVATEVEVSGPSAIVRCLRAEPSCLMPALVAVVSVSLLEFTDIQQADWLIRNVFYAAAIAATMIVCLVFVDLRGLLRTAASVR
jgi:O-antigen/teichoic acid export membrane protein